MGRFALHTAVSSSHFSLAFKFFPTPFHTPSASAPPPVSRLYLCPLTHLPHASCALSLCVGHLLSQVVQVEHVAERRRNLVVCGVVLVGGWEVGRDNKQATVREEGSR